MERGGTQELWRKSIVDGRETLVVPGDRYQRVSPVWSYDNSRVMYLRTSHDGQGDASGSEIVTVPASGGQEQVLRPAAQLERLFDWSADGSWILGAARRRTGVPYELVLLPADANSGAERRVLALDSQSNLWKARLSADQRWVAFTVPTGPGVSAIYAVPFAGGDRVKITSGEFFDDRPRWSTDGRIVYLLSSRSGFFNVWARRFDPERGVALGDRRYTFRQALLRAAIPGDNRGLCEKRAASIGGRFRRRARGHARRRRDSGGRDRADGG